jgi:hypothetical protein
MNRWATSGGTVSRVLFTMPQNGGIRKIYIIVVALLEMLCVLTLQPGLLIELEMLVYALSAILFFYSFIYLRWQRNKKFGKGGYDDGADVALFSGKVKTSLDADEVGDDPTVYTIPGGMVVAVLMVLFPMAAFTGNTIINVMDDGGCTPLALGGFTCTSGAPFPYFKLVCLFGLILLGVLIHSINFCLTRRIARTAAANWSDGGWR